MERIWWERVPNALAYTSDIIESLLDGKSIVLHSTGVIPWYDYMAAGIKEELRQRNASKTLETLEDVSEPGAYLLKEFCKAEKRAEYRPSKSYARFFAESKDIVLHETIFWVMVSSRDQLESWLSFVSDYNKELGKNRDGAVFILEWQGESNIVSKKGITVYSFDDYINEYDRIAFCTLAASTVRESRFIKNYLTELVANVVDNDIEMCAMCLENYNDFLEDPLGEMNRIAENYSRTDGSSFNIKKTKGEVHRMIWLSQIRTVYPSLEEFRESFIQRHHSAIAKQLPIPSSYGDPYENPEDVELGTLKYMADDGRIYLDRKEYERLRLFKEARNNLSHLSVLSLNEIKQLGL